MDRMDAAGLPWKLYTGPVGPNMTTGYGWAMCPSFSDRIYTGQKTNMVANSQIVADAQAGTLPAFSVVTPTRTDRQAHKPDHPVRQPGLVTIGDNPRPDRRVHVPANRLAVRPRVADNRP
jgi:hypothetical protein